MPAHSTAKPTFTARNVEHPRSLRLIVGAIVLTICVWGFGAIAEDVSTNDPIVQLDLSISSWFEAHATPGIIHAMQLFTLFGSFPVVAAITVLALGYMAWRGWKSWMVLMVLAVAGSELLNVALKNLFHRTRPQFTHPFLTLTSFSFPSGHAMAATTLYGFLVVWTLSETKAWRLRVMALVGGTLLISLVGLSRIYLGAHFMSDVLAAMAAGAAWLALCVTALGAHRRIKSPLKT